MKNKLSTKRGIINKIIFITLALGLSISGICQTYHSSSYNEYPLHRPVNLNSDHKTIEAETIIKIETINESGNVMGGVYGQWEISINDVKLCEIYMILFADAYGVPYTWDEYGSYKEYVINPSRCNQTYRTEILKFENSLLIVDIENEKIILYNDLH